MIHNSRQPGAECDDSDDSEDDDAAAKKIIERYLEEAKIDQLVGNNSSELQLSDTEV